MGKKIHIGIVGSRRRASDADLRIVYEIVESHPDAVIVSGGCPKGADAFAEIAAEELGNETIIHLPQKPPKGSPRWAYTKANYARNTLIAEDSDILYALVHEDRKGGTEDTIKKGEKLGKKIILK